MQVLFIIGGNHLPKLALIDHKELKDYDLDLINGESDLSEDQITGDQISMILDRLGLEPFSPFISEGELRKEDEKNPPKQMSHEEWLASHPFTTDQDLKQYLDPCEPFVVDQVVMISMLGS